MRLLVCGSRDWTDINRLWATLDPLIPAIDVVIEGGARGADLMAAAWANHRGIAVERYPADWKAYGKAAGYKRNEQMLAEGRPDLVIAFPLGESRGTWMMVRLARGAGVPVLVVPA
jgi:SLOG family YspA-like protein